MCFRLEFAMLAIHIKIIQKNPMEALECALCIILKCILRVYQYSYLVYCVMKLWNNR